MVHFSGITLQTPSLLIDTTPSVTTPSNYKTALMDSPLAVGRTWSDPAASVHLTVMAAAASASPPYLTVIAYRSPASNGRPVISAIKLSAITVCTCKAVQLTCESSDPDGRASCIHALLPQCAPMVWSIAECARKCACWLLTTPTNQQLPVLRFNGIRMGAGSWRGHASAAGHEDNTAHVEACWSVLRLVQRERHAWWRGLFEEGGQSQARLAASWFELRAHVTLCI